MKSFIVIVLSVCLLYFPIKWILGIFSGVISQYIFGLPASINKTEKQITNELTVNNFIIKDFLSKQLSIIKKLALIHYCISILLISFLIYIFRNDTANIYFVGVMAAITCVIGNTTVDMITTVRFLKKQIKQ